MKRSILTRIMSLVLMVALIIQDVSVSAASRDDSDNKPIELIPFEQPQEGTAKEIKEESTEEAGEKNLEIVAEEESLRKEKEKHFRMNDGSYIAAAYNEPVHYMDSAGNWQEIDNRLSEKEDHEGNQIYVSS